MVKREKKCEKRNGEEKTKKKKKKIVRKKIAGEKTDEKAQERTIISHVRVAQNLCIVLRILRFLAPQAAAFDR